MGLARREPTSLSRLLRTAGSRGWVVKCIGPRYGWGKRWPCPYTMLWGEMSPPKTEGETETGMEAWAGWKQPVVNMGIVLCACEGSMSGLPLPSKMMEPMSAR